MRLLAAFAAACLLSYVPAGAADTPGYKIHHRSGTYSDVRDGLEQAIVARGFVVDYVGHLNTMLERTSEAAGSVSPLGLKSPYKQAQYMHFCAAKLTHEAVSANPHAIASCPFVLFIYELARQPGEIHVGYRLPVGGPSMVTNKINTQIEALMEEIALAAFK